MSFKNALRMMGTGMAIGAPKVPNGMADPGTHLQSAMTAHKKGDHQGAKRHALRAVNMLHAMSQGAPSAPPAGASAATAAP